MKLRRLKWVLFLLIALPIAAIVAVYATLASRDFNELRQIAEREVRGATGRDLSIEGPIDIALSLTPALELEDIRFANAPGGSAEDMARVQRMEVQIALLPLIGGDIEVKRFVLKDADILLETDADGRPNWVFAKPGDQEDAESQEPAESLEQSQRETRQRLPSLEALHIENSRVTWRDGVSGETLVVALDEAQVREADDRLQIEANGSYQDLPFSLTGNVGTPDQLFAAGDYPLNLEGDLAQTRFGVNGSLSGLADTPSADLNLSVEGEDLPALSRLAGRELPDVGRYGINGRVTYDGQAVVFEDLQGQVADSQLRTSGRASGLDQGAPLISADVAAEGPSLERLGEIAGAALPPLGAWQLEGKLEAEQNSVRLSELSAQLGESDLAGQAEIALGGERPSLRAQIQSQLLDMAALMPAEEDGAAQEGSSDGEDSPFVIPDTPLPLEGLHAVDADIQAQVERLRLPNGLEIEALALSATLADGALAIEPTNLVFYEGQLAGEVRIDARQQPPAVRSDLALQGLNMGQLLRERGISEAVEGTLDARLDLTGSGASPRAIASSLDGESELNVGEGVISNRLLAIIGSGLGEIMNPLFGGQDTTQLHCVISRISFDGGVATNHAALIDTSTFSVAGSGRIDLRDETLDLHFDTSSRVPALVSLAVPFNVGGTLKDPSFAPDPLGTAQRAAQLAGVTVAPPAALSAMIGMSETEAAAENPCATALEAEGEAPAEAAPQQRLEELGQQLEERLPEGLEGAGEGIGRQLRGLFGN